MTDQEKLAIIRDLIADCLDSKAEEGDVVDSVIKDNRRLVALMEHIEDVLDDKPFDLNQRSTASN